MPLDAALTMYQRTKRHEEIFLAVFLFVTAIGLVGTLCIGILVIHNQGRILNENRKVLVIVEQRVSNLAPPTTKGP